MFFSFIITNIILIYDFFYDNISLVNFFVCSYLSETKNTQNSILSFLNNPHVDLDLSVNTDCEDMLAFLSDIIEFTEQDKMLLIDSLFDA